MKKTMKKSLSIFLSLLILSFAVLTSCTSPLKISDEEALSVLKELVPKSYDINVIFFGEGLPAVDEAYEKEHDSTSYYEVRSDCGYASVNEIKAAAEKVYSKQYLDSIYVSVFSGVASESGLDASLSARYKELGGKLVVDVSKKAWNIRGRLEVLSAEVTKKTKDYVKISASCKEGGEDVSVDFLLTKENGVWLLDGPTY